MAWLLSRRLSGLNEILEVEDDIKDKPGISDLNEFLKENGLFTHEAGLELGQVLKVSCDNLIKASVNKKGYISGDAKNNILSYLKSVGRISPRLLSFLQSQQGDRGQLNSYTWSGDDQ